MNKKILSWLTVVGVAFVLSALWLQVNPAQSLAETQTIEITSSLPSPAQNFIGWPYYLVVWVFGLVLGDLEAARAVSLICGLITALAIFLLLKRPFGVGLGLIGLSLVVTNSWFIALVKSGTPEIAAIALLTACCLAFTQLNGWRYWLLGLLALAWFMPLLSWLVLLGGLYVLFKPEFKPIKTPLILLLLSLSLVSFWDLLSEPIGALEVWGQFKLDTWQTDITQAASGLVWQAPLNPTQWVGQFPLLDVLGIAMLPFGLRFLKRKLSWINLGWLALGFLGLVGLLGLNGGLLGPGAGLLIIFTLLLASLGLAEFCRLWFNLFPVNPLARSVGLVAILTVVTLSGLYQTNRYFKAHHLFPGSQQQVMVGE